MEFLRHLFDSQYFMAHGYCYLWQPDILWMHTGADALIALSYFLIPIALVYLVAKRHDLAYKWMFLLFGLFIVSCGTTHVLSIVTVWEPVYRLEGLVKLVTAICSLPTAIALFALMPTVLHLPSPRQLREANEKLAEEASQRRLSEAEVRRINAELEERIADRTRELTVLNEKLKRSEDRLRLAQSAAKATPWDWNIHTGRIRWETIACVGSPREQSGDFAEFLASIHADDREKVEREMTAAASRNGSELHVEFRMPRQDDGVCWAAALGRVVGESSGRMAGILIDTTERVHGEQSIRASKEQYQLLFESNPQPMWVFDRSTLRFLAVNRAAVDLYGFSEEEFLSMTIEQIRPPSELDRLHASLSRLEVRDFERAGLWRHCKKNGELLTVEIGSHRISTRVTTRS